jgi:hypothetical protein
MDAKFGTISLDPWSFKPSLNLIDQLSVYVLMSSRPCPQTYAIVFEQLRLPSRFG